jgi:1,4-alpha-glucan branching enzyme
MGSPGQGTFSHRRFLRLVARGSSFATLSGDWCLGRALRLKDGDLYKVHRVGANGAHDRMPSHASFLVQDDVSKAFSAQVVDQPDFQWQYDPPGEVKAPRIYEAHVGMATEEYRVGTYREFADEILPRIAHLGYNVV